MFKRILVPLDGSNLAEKVLPFAVNLAQQLRATLILFHVVEMDAPDEIHGQRHLREAAEAKAYLDEVAARFASTEVSIIRDVHEFQDVGVAQTIRNHAIELDADLVVMCAHGSGGLRDVFFGSIAQQVIRQGNTPLLFIRPEIVTGENVRPLRRILVPLDGSKSHEEAIPVAAYLAKKYEAAIHLLTVIPSAEDLPVRQAITRRISPRMTALALNLHVKQAETYLQEQSQALAAKGNTVTDTVLQGDVSTELVDAIESEGVDLVVMATHCHSVIDARWEGSLTPRFLPKAPVPVILVRGAGRNGD